MSVTWFGSRMAGEAKLIGRRCKATPTSKRSEERNQRPKMLAERCAAPVWWFERCAQNPIPSRTRPLNAPAPMVLCLKTRESRSPPDLHRTRPNHSLSTITGGAGWSSPVARQAHNLKVTGSNPVPATKPRHEPKARPGENQGGLLAFSGCK